MINMSGALVDKVDSMQEQMDHVSKETEILRTNQNKMLVSKHLIEIRTEIKNECNRLISRMNTTEEKKSQFENISIQNAGTEKQREMKLKKKHNRIFRNFGGTAKCLTYT